MLTKKRKIRALASGYPPIIMRCPNEMCSGWIRGADDTGWYCEDCGYEWSDREELNASIAEVVSKYPYRRACYVKRRGDYLPAPREREPAKYKKLVEREVDSD